MSKLLNDLPELVQAQIISEETAQNIRHYYESKPSQASNRLFIVFGILGALLVGLGIILIIAHNWDTLGKTTKLLFALMPLLLGQAFCAYALGKKQESAAWRESSSVFLIMAIASSISIVGQVYNLEGNLARFLLAWMILSLPVIYIMRSSLAAMLFIVGITWYACEVSYFHYPQHTAWGYWLLLLLALPHYFMLLKNQSRGNFLYFHSWLLTISVAITLGMFAKGTEELMLIAYISLFGALISIGQLKPFSESRVIANAPLIVGSLGTVSLLLTLSFEWYWKEISEDSISNWSNQPEFYICLVTGIIASIFLIGVARQKPFSQINLKSFAFIVILVLFVIGIRQPILSQIIINILIFFTGVFTIRDGALQNRLGVLNYGLLILTALITCRFFDIDISFVARGLMFVAVGLGFFIANYWMIKKRKDQPALPR